MIRIISIQIDSRILAYLYSIMFEDKIFPFLNVHDIALKGRAKWNMNDVVSKLEFPMLIFLSRVLITRVSFQ